VSRFSGRWHLACQEAVVTQLWRLAFVMSCLIVAAGPTRAEAQDAGPPAVRSLVPATFPRWDAGGSSGLLNIAASEIQRPWYGWDHKFAYRAEIGRYWTTHLKTELTVAASNGADDYEVDLFPGPSPSSPIYGYNIVERRLTVLAPAVTWQFRENAFTHPYVSGGVHLGLLQQHRFRAPDTYRFGTSVAQVLPLDERTTTTVTRPFVAAGFKSYISRRAFVRTEGRVAFSSAGARQVWVLAGVGFDF
jgi:hypothetical protein